jgi:photosystem II stability/assembly factor-like uncharacterized protein
MLGICNFSSPDFPSAAEATVNKPLFWLLIIVGAAFLSLPVSFAARDDADRTLTAADLSPLTWRPIGPANMGGRVSAVALVPGSRTDFYVGFATGGLFKTTNLGTTFQEVFRHEATSSIGAVGVANADPHWSGWDDLAAAGDTVPLADRTELGAGRIVWVGTGEGNGRNSVSWGNGVYRSTDGGATFTHVGLTETHNIPSLAIDPRSADICYIAAMGHLWGKNPQRGVFKTSDGGGTWEHVLKVSDEVGACDVVIDPENPDTVYAALYAARRTPWSFDGFSDEGGIHRSVDGGQTWTRLTAGLPASTGRIGLAIFPGNPDILYAVVESDQGGTGRSAWDDRSPAGGLFRSDDRGDTWRRVNELNFRPFYFSRVAVDPVDSKRVYMPGWDLAISDDGGVTFRRSGSTEVHVDHHAIVIDPADPERILLGNDGGLYLSHDRAATWDYLNHLNVGQFYHVDVDDAEVYRVGGGLQDNGSWIGPSATAFNSGSENQPGILNADWTAVHGGDGFRVAFDPIDPDIIYATSQGGNLVRIHLDTQLKHPLRPAADEGQERLRFNWDAPFLISRHDPTVLYHAGNKVFKLLARGEHWYAISEDLSRREVDKVMSEGSQAETYGTVVALSESPLQPGVLWAGTDDGLVHVTFDDGAAWREITPRQSRGHYVAHLEASFHDQQTAYCAIDGHRSDVFDARILMTTNGGGKWREITGDLPPDSPVRIVREDPRNPDVLYCGNERSVYVTCDRGRHWLPLGGTSLPTVPVYDLAIQRREMDLVAGTHGRSLWIMDGMGCLAELPLVKAEPLHLFPVKDATAQLFGFRGYGSGNRVFKGPNPPSGAVITFWLRDLPAAAVAVRIENQAGQEIKTLSSPGRPGLNRLVWDLQADPKHRFKNPRRSGPVFVEPGVYRAVVSDGQKKDQVEFTVHPYPGWIPPDAKAQLPPAGPNTTSDRE